MNRSPWPLSGILGFDLGAALDRDRLAASGLIRRVADPDPEIEIWTDTDESLSVSAADNVVFLVATRRELIIHGHALVGHPCEEVARFLDPPDRFDHITGEWIYVSGPDEFALWFFEGFVERVSLFRSGDDVEAAEGAEP